MNSDPLRDWRRWIRAEDEGRDDDADAAFGTVFRAVPRASARPGFADRVMLAVAQAEARRARRARVAAFISIAASAVLGVSLVIALVAYSPRLLLWTLDAAVQAALWIVDAVGRGLDVWAILAQVGRTTAAIVAAPQVTFSLVAIGLVGVMALYGLHRIFGLEQESSR
jgi:hypothetical protein